MGSFPETSRKLACVASVSNRVIARKLRNCLADSQHFYEKRIIEWLMCFFQVTKERVKLLSHPLVTYLLRYKWRSFGRYVYYGRLILYGIFLFFLTGYAMHTTKSIPMTVCKERECTCNVTFDTGTPGSRVVWRKIGLPVILITTSISMFLEVRNLHRYR